MFKINYLKEQHKKEKTVIKRNLTEEDLNTIISKIPFELTGDQLKAIEEIRKDLNSSSRMNRILQGDVGSGKTIVFKLFKWLSKCFNVTN